MLVEQITQLPIQDQSNQKLTVNAVSLVSTTVKEQQPAAADLW